VNNAGISDPGLFECLPVAQFRRMVEVHYFGTLFVTRAAWPHLVHAGYGRVVNTVSEAMLGGLSELSSYGAAKGAVFGLTRNLATEGARHGIRVNAIAPRAYTRMSAEQSDKVAAQMSLTPEVMDQINASMPPDLCAPAAAYLAHETCSLSGEVLQAGMGVIARIAVLCSQGFSKQAMTAEDIADNLEKIMSLEDARVADAVAPQL
jgi:NAD(P)-dependent dehydrogenase (short-subunit alcohol dehydrogenase family)